MKKNKYCEFSLANLSLISGCNILSAIVELFLLIVAAMIFRYSLSLSESTLLRYVLVVMIAILAFAFCLTFLLMMSEAFVKVRKEISQILSVLESEQLGLREIRTKSAKTLNRTHKNIHTLHMIASNGPGRGNHRAINPTNENPNPLSFHFVEINP
jgi:ABC-type multidrug transport system fused ATPase/permease subunit